MTENKMALLVLNDTIENFETEQQDKIEVIADKFREIMKEAQAVGEEEEAFSQLAISLVGIETAVALEK